MFKLQYYKYTLYCSIVQINSYFFAKHTIERGKLLLKKG